jgi:hypothetical protein
MSLCLRYRYVQPPSVLTGVLMTVVSLLFKIWVRKFSAISRLRNTCMEVISSRITIEKQFNRSVLLNRHCMVNVKLSIEHDPATSLLYVISVAPFYKNISSKVHKVYSCASTRHCAASLEDYVLRRVLLLVTNASSR